MLLNCHKIVVSSLKSSGEKKKDTAVAVSSLLAHTLPQVLAENLLLN